MDTFVNRTTKPRRVCGGFVPDDISTLVGSQVVGGGMAEPGNALERHPLPKIVAIDLSRLVCPGISGRPALSSNKPHSTDLSNAASSAMVGTRQLVLDPHD